MDAGPDRPPPRHLARNERPRVRGAPRQATDAAPARHGAGTGRLLPGPADWMDALGPRSPGYDATCRATRAPRSGAAAAGWRGGLPRAGARSASRPSRRLVREEPGTGRSHPARMAAVSHPPLRASREADPRAPRVVSRKDKRKLTVRVPNPKAPVKGRLTTQPHKVHSSAKRYRRGEKYPSRGAARLQRSRGGRRGGGPGAEGRGLQYHGN